MKYLGGKKAKCSLEHGCVILKRSKMQGEVCALTRSSEDGDLQDDSQAVSRDMDWLIEPMLRKSL